MISKQYKWVVLNGAGGTYIKEKPKKIRGGYMNKHGHRWIGKNVELIPRLLLDTRR